MNNNTRIDLFDTLQRSIIKMSDGNPGALQAMLELCMKSPEIDPDSAFREFTPLLSLDSMGIYGSRIWLLYNDVCGRDALRSLAMLRAVQLGILSKVALLHAMEDYGTGIDVENILKEVRDRLPNFGKERANAQS